MNIELSREQKMIVESAKEVGKKFGPDYWYEQDNNQNESFPWEFFRTIGDVGIAGLGIPEEYGGSGLGLTELVIAIEALCANGGGVAPAIAILLGSIFGGTAIMRHGNEQQKKKYLSKIAKGKMCTSLGVTEADAGTNTLDIRTVARKEDDVYIIDGSKIFISGVEDADILVLLARTADNGDNAKKSVGLSLFLVELPNSSIKYSEIPKHGIQFIKTYELGIDGLRVPQSSLLGEKDMGWYHVLDTLNPERIVASAGSVGCGRLAIKTAANYSKKRRIFNRPIGSNQGIQFPLASAYSKLECAHLAMLKAASLYDKKVDSKQVGDIANMAKYASVEAAIEAVYHSMQTLGGYGFAKEYHIERWWRDLQIVRVAPIAQQLTLSYISEHVLGLPRSF